jgi:hypothetical protein
MLVLCCPVVNNDFSDVESHPKRHESSKLTYLYILYGYFTKRKSYSIGFQVKACGNMTHYVKGTLLPSLVGASRCERYSLKSIKYGTSHIKIKYHQSNLCIYGYLLYFLLPVTASSGNQQVHPDTKDVYKEEGKSQT